MSRSEYLNDGETSGVSDADANADICNIAGADIRRVNADDISDVRPATRVVRLDGHGSDPHGASAPPIYQTATFAQPAADTFGDYDYTRSGNPTRSDLERHLAGLEQANHALTFASGMSAITAVARLVKPGERIVAGEDIYGGTGRLLSGALATIGVEVVYVDATDADAVRDALDGDARLLLVETPSNPLLRIADVRRLADVAHDAGAWLAVDNSCLSPWLQRPLELGADVAIQSATKHLSGHGDGTGGVVCTNDDDLAARLAWTRNAEGTALAPFESWLLLRGVRTLGIRLDRAQQNARRVADFLASHPAVTQVHFPGLDDHPGRAVHEAQARGPGALISFETGCAETSKALIESLSCFSICVSFGSIASQASLPGAMSHASLPPELRIRCPLPRDLVRLSIGIEDVDDLVADLDRALSHAGSCKSSRAEAVVEAAGLL